MFTKASIVPNTQAKSKSRKSLGLTFWALAMGIGNPLAQSPINVGQGSYFMGVPSGWAVPETESGAVALPSLAAGVQGPVPTNDWWSSLVFRRQGSFAHGHTLYAQPWVIQANGKGIALGHGPTASGNPPWNDSYVYGVPMDLQIGLEGQSNTATEVKGWDDIGPTVQQFQGQVEWKIGHGMTGVQWRAQSGTTLVSCAGTPVIWARKGSWLGFSVGERHYGLYAPSGATWTESGMQLKSTLAQKGYLWIAVLPDNKSSTFELYGKHAFAWVQSDQVAWNILDASSQAQTIWTLKTQVLEGNEERPLMALSPHQWRFLKGQATSGLEYASPRGKLKVLGAKELVIEQPYRGWTPSLPLNTQKLSAGDLNLLKQELATESARPDGELIRVNGDTYWTGKDLGRTSQLIWIADQLSETSIRERLLNLMQNRLENWLTASPGEKGSFFAYEPKWGTLIGYPASYGSDKELNDHHFHYGYYVWAAATLAHFRPQWANAGTWREMLDEVIGDAANADRSSKRYPFLRNMDPWAGHSWAAGHANFGDGNNQESSSEALMFAAGLALWGEVTARPHLKNQGLWMHTVESHSFLEYWWDAYQENFPKWFDRKVLGMVWGSKGSHATWFSAEPEMIHGINLLPVTGASLYLGDHPQILLGQFAEMEKRNGGPVQEWREVHWQSLAMADAGTALSRLRSAGNWTAEEGDSRTHASAMILGLAQLGTRDTATRCSSPFATSFGKAPQRTFIAWNGTDKSQNISCGGKSFVVPARKTLQVSEGDVIVGVQRDAQLRNHKQVQGKLGQDLMWDVSGRPLLRGNRTWQLLPEWATGVGFGIGQGSVIQGNGREGSQGDDFKGLE
jgi:endoglucanase Acf2